MSQPRSLESSHLDGGSNVLVQVDPGRSMFDACSEDDPDRHVLAVTYDRLPGEWFAEYRAATNGNPDQFAMLAVGATTRGGAATADASPSGAPFLVDAVASASDTSRLCERIGEVLDGWPDGTAVVYFDSLTVLLQHVDPLEATRFLHVTSWTVRQAGATAYYRLDRDTHDEQLATRLGPLFDEIRSTTDDRHEETGETLE